MSMLRVTVVTTIAEREIFDRDLRPSVEDEVASGACELIFYEKPRSMSSALNAGIAAARADLVVCAHQDVALSPGWLPRLEHLALTAPKPWGVLGPAGTTSEGKMYGTHSGLGMDGYEHVTAQTLDGSCLILKKSSGLRFDENLTRFHGYDVDLCMEAGARALACYVIYLPMEHRTQWLSTSRAGGAQDFQDALGYVSRKWHERGAGPIHTTFGTY